MIFIIDDHPEMAACIKRIVEQPTRIFSNAIEAIAEIANGNLPRLIFLDILLDGPDGFTFLNELVSYKDTAAIPVVIVSSLDFKQADLAQYNIVGILNKDTMLPEEIKSYVAKYC